MKFVSVEGHTGLYRDMHSGAVVNSDLAALNAAKKRKESILLEKENTKKLEKRVEWLESQLIRLLEEKENDN